MAVSQPTVSQPTVSLIPGSAQHKAEIARLSQRAAECAAINEHHDAIPIWEELDRLMPDHEGIAAGLGAALVGAGKYRAALAKLSRQSLRFPTNAVLLRLQAHAMLRLGDGAEAIGALIMVLELDPHDVDAHADLAVALHRLHKPAIALKHAAFAFTTAPSVSNAAIIVDVLLDLDRGDDALELLDHPVLMKNDPSKLLLVKSFCLRALGRNDEAVATIRKALQAAPDDENTRAGVAMALLADGQFTPEAWALYESRAGVLGIRKWPNPEQRWQGQDLAGKTILVHAEQGFGDTINFVRYVPKLAAMGAIVILVVQPILTRLLQGTQGADRVMSGGASLPDFDYYTPLLSLPGLLGTTIDTVPPPLPLMLPSNPRSFVARDGTLHVGLVWNGNRAFIDNGKRSIDAAMLAPLAAIPGVTFHSLQLEANDAPFQQVNDLMQGVTDFADTAERITELDLVISVDTSVAHLAATMGKPVWLLSRFHGCWRWLLEGEETSWYPTMRLYRQRRLNDWGHVIDRIVTDLGLLAAGRILPATQSAEMLENV